MTPASHSAIRAMTSAFLLLLLVGGSHLLEPAWAQNQPTTAFVNVNVVPMDTEQILKNQTVIVEADRIIAIGAADEVALPAQAKVIDGNGDYLMPGLADMHTHLWLRDPDPGHLVLYLAEGTTTVRSMSGAPENFEWRERIEQGELVGPTIYSAGRILIGMYDDLLGYNWMIRAFRIAIFFLPLLLGAVVFLLIKRIRSRWTAFVGIPVLLLVGLVLTVTKTPPFMTIFPLLDPRPGHLSESPAQAVIEVRAQHKLGVDVVKVYDGLTEAEYLAAIAEANELGIYVAGHALDQIPLETILTSGIDEIAHLGELNFYHWRGFPGQEGFSLDYDSVPQTVALFKNNNVGVVSNLVTDETLYRLIFDTPGVLVGPEYAVVRPELIEAWRTHGRQVTTYAAQGPYRENEEMPFFKTLVKAFHDAGVTITIATDTSSLVEGTVPSQIHRELELLVEAGFSNYEALEAGTKNAGIIVNKMGRDGSFGTVADGQRADLILLEENPLENVSHTRNRVGVMTHGRWFTQAELDQLVDKLVATY